METKDKRLEFRLSERELTALDRLVELEGLDYRAQWITRQIQLIAKRKKVWK